jgi:hypothetical protein
VPLSTKGQWGQGVSSEKGCFAICSGRFLHDLYLFWFDITHESEHQWTTMNTDELQGWIFPIFTTMALQTVPASHAATIAAVRCRSLSFGRELWLS